MSAPLSGVRILEVASHVFVPMSGAVLSEWGADVIKIEHPETGDPYRGLVTAGLHKLHGGIDPQFQSTNRGKRSVGLDLKHPEGRRILGRLLENTDVFVTNLRADTRRTLCIDVDDVRADNPSLIYVRGTAFGSRGPDANRGGYDAGRLLGPHRHAARLHRARGGVAGGATAGLRRRGRRPHHRRRDLHRPLPPGHDRRAVRRRRVPARRRHVAGADRHRERLPRRGRPAACLPGAATRPGTP